MAAAIIIPVITSILGKITSSPGDLIFQEIKAAKSTKKDLNFIAGDLEAIRAVLEDAEQKQFTNTTIQIWLRELKNIAYDIDHLLDEVAFHALERKLNLLSWHRRLKRYTISRFSLSHKIRDLRENIQRIVQKKNDYGLTERPVEMPSNDTRETYSYVHESSILGRDRAKTDILTKLVEASRNDIHPTVLPIVGMGGIGKTELAKLVYHAANTFDIKLWACVSDKFQLRQIIEDVLKSGGQNLTSNQSLEALVNNLHDLLDGKKYFLVLDDVWIQDSQQWEKLRDMLRVGKAGSVVLITTRNNEVASCVVESVVGSPYRLDRLPDDVCWSIFKEIAFRKGEEHRYQHLFEIGELIVKNCHGIPLVVKSLASLLKNKRDVGEWRRICDSNSFIGLDKEYDKVLQLLELSYDNLPSHLKPCFSYLALMVKDMTIQSSFRSYYWSALGLLQIEQGDTIVKIGYKYMMDLVSRSLIQEPTYKLEGLFCTSKMHDLLHDLALKTAEDLEVVTQENLNISNDTRHIVWGYDGGLKDKKFPQELSKFDKKRTFRFAYREEYISRSFLEGIITKFKCLRVLDIGYSWFEEMPSTIGKLMHLRMLNLSYNPLLKSLPNTICKLLNLETLVLEGCENLKELPGDVNQLWNLKNFAATTCQSSLNGMKFNELSSLQVLEFRSCRKLVSLWDNGKVGRLTSLKILYVKNCPKLKSLPHKMKFLVHLEQLFLDDCEDLDLEQEETFIGLQRLVLLRIRKLPKLACLPQGIKSASASLRYLTMDDCKGLKQLPDCLEQFSSLHKIFIVNCPMLKRVPTGMYNLKSQPLLNFERSPYLTNTGEAYLQFK